MTIEQTANQLRNTAHWLDVGTYGAKRQTWKDKNPRVLVMKILEKNADADLEEVKDEIRQRIRRDDEYFEAVLDHWLSNTLRSIRNEKSASQPEQRAKIRKSINASVDAIKRKHATIVKDEARMILLDMIMPNGKPLRENTGRDCERAGGLFSQIAKLIKPSEIVGKVLSEAEIRKLYGK